MAALLLLALLAGCGNDDNGGNEGDPTPTPANDTQTTPTPDADVHPLVGTWEYNDADTYEFRADGTGQAIIFWSDGTTNIVDFEWDTSGDVLYMTFVRIWIEYSDGSAEEMDVDDVNDDKDPFTWQVTDTGRLIMESDAVFTRI